MMTEDGDPAPPHWFHWMHNLEPYVISIDMKYLGKQLIHLVYVNVWYLWLICIKS